MTGVTAAGSPGPLETKTASGPSASTSPALVPAGTTSSRQPAPTSPWAMLSFMPQSIATTRGPSSPSRRGAPAASDARSRPSSTGCARTRSSSSSGVSSVVTPPRMAPWSRSRRTRRRVSQPSTATMPRSRSQVRQPTGPPAPAASPARAMMTAPGQGRSLSSWPGPAP